MSRTPRERCGLVFLPRDAAGRVQAIDPLERFRAKCRFDPHTGCVLWTGGTTRGRGNTAVYGSFWYEGARWAAHRWAGVHIHGLDLDGHQAGHNCPHGPNTLCVEHITAQTLRENMEEQYARLGPIHARQTPDQRQYWLLVDRGYEQVEPLPAQDPEPIPFYEPPAWLRGSNPAPATEDCPF